VISTVLRYGKVKARRPTPGAMNRTEERYAGHLEKLKRIGDIVDYGFETYKLRLADNTFYTPDFHVIESDLTLSFREVKGFWRDDARVKIKVAASRFPQHKFVAVSWDAKLKCFDSEEF
jgi:hypothetical protein